MADAEAISRDLGDLVELFSEIEQLPPVEGLAAVRRAKRVERLKRLTNLLTETHTHVMKKPTPESMALIQTQVILALELANGLIESESES